MAIDSLVELIQLLVEFTLKTLFSGHFFAKQVIIKQKAEES